MLDALGVVAYSRVRLAKAWPASIIQPTLRAAPERLNEKNGRNDPAHGQDPGASASMRVVSVPAAPAPASAILRSVAKSPIATRAASVRSELVLPSAEIDRFLESRMYSHFCLLFAQGAPIPVVENAVVSDTALHFELPPKAPLKLGSMALLRSAWRAKRQAWLAIRLWRKQQR